ncbi:membrane protein FAM174B isoform X1 [Camelus ferus]|uniref:Membrane protein FAM174B isoform X1 n=2 Tax=Camelus ferus TaxID=419612 RepID=A0A8B8S3E1_CAMFR|nr:membrane protein FAM174B isoform X1 [Camelus ferus]
MRAAPPPPARPLRLLLLLLALLAAPAARASRAESAAAPQPGPELPPQPPPGPGPGNATWAGSGAAAGGGGLSSSGNALVTRISSLLRDLPTLKAAVIVACAFIALLIACLVLRVFRSGKRLKKTRKYDIITTPAERVEMAPLNEEDDEDEDSTVFDIKYRTRTTLQSLLWNFIPPKQRIMNSFSGQCVRKNKHFKVKPVLQCVGIPWKVGQLKPGA